MNVLDQPAPTPDEQIATLFDGGTFTRAIDPGVAEVTLVGWGLIDGRKVFVFA